MYASEACGFRVHSSLLDSCGVIVRSGSGCDHVSYLPFGAFMAEYPHLRVSLKSNCRLTKHTGPRCAIFLNLEAHHLALGFAGLDEANVFQNTTP